MSEKANPTVAVKLFISYAHEDEKLREKLVKQLSTLKRQGAIEGWHDRDITAGSEWSGQIDEHLEQAGIILLLISADFLDSDFCSDVELKRAMERHKSGSARVIPIILRSCDWQSAPFGKLQALPKDAKPVREWESQDKAFTNIVQGLRKVIGELTNTSGTDRIQPEESLEFAGQQLSDDKKDKGRAANAEISLDVWLSDDEGGGLEDAFDVEGEELKYSATQKDGVLFIEPDCPYLDNLYLRGQVSPIFILDPDETSFNLIFPQLDFKIANNSSKTVLISRAVFEVEESRLDPRPVPFFATDWVLLFKCRLINDGWGEIKNGLLQYRISKGVESEDAAQKFPFKKPVSNFAESTELDFSPDMKALGVDVETIQRINADWSEQKIQWDDFQDELRIAKGSFAALENVSINGVLTYDQPTSGGLLERKDVRFSVEIPITPPEGLGGAALATGTYDVMLDLDRDSYTVVHSLSHSIKKGAVDRFLIRVGAKKSSFHKFKVGLVLTGGEELTSQDINLSLFIPRRNAKELSEGDRSGGN
jgi:hypothetical protein